MRQMTVIDFNSLINFVQITFPMTLKGMANVNSMISKFLNERYFSFCNSLSTVSENPCRSSCISY